MENKPKSKAFIITFIIVLILLFIGYLLLKNSGSNTTKGASSLSKIFAPLLGTSKEKNLTTVDNTTSGTGTGANNTGTKANGQNPDGTLNGGTLGSGSLGNSTDLNGASGTGSGSGLLNGGTTGSGSLSGNNSANSKLNSLPTPQSNSNLNSSTSTTTLTTTGQTAATADTTSTKIAASLCPVDDPLSNYFTDQEKKDLDSYLRQFYLIAPTIRTADDVTVAQNEILENTSFSTQLKSLYNDCKIQKANPKYTGPQTVKDNPYYQEGNEAASYLPGKSPSTTDQTYSTFEKLLYIW